MKTSIFWNVTPSILAEVCRRYGETLFLHFQGQTITLAASLLTDPEDGGRTFPANVINLYQSKRHNIRDDNVHFFWVLKRTATTIQWKSIRNGDLSFCTNVEPKNKNVTNFHDAGSNSTVRPADPFSSGLSKSCIWIMLSP